ncbi:hypothetical protein [Actinoplanes philippinensis]|uniref:hypothetical protein n=1 Tax=Actinoplanes philippinensis TaxID=35752 RepID=UPI000B857598|nr:hypothetical protein [Actinoplanes philippinensis]
MEAFDGARHDGRGGQRRPLDGDLGGELPGAGRDAAEVDGRLGDADRGAAQGGGGGGGDPAVAGGEAAQGFAGLDGAGQVVAGGGDGELGDQGHLVAAGPANPGQPRLPPGTEHPLPDARVAFAQVVVEFADADPAVPVAVGGAAGDAFGDHPGEGGRLGARGGGDDDAALSLGGAGGPEVVAGVDRATGAAVEQHHRLFGTAALQQRGDLGDIDAGVRGPPHHGVRGGQVQPAAGPGQHHAPEVEEDTVLLVTPLEQGLDPPVGLARPRIAQMRRLEPAERRIREHVRERRNIGRRHGESAQHGIFVLLDADDYRKSSPVHRMHHPSSMVRCRGRTRNPEKITNRDFSTAERF